MLGQILDGRYKIIRELGAGGFGQTYVAEDIKLYNNQCVVKLLKPMASDPMTLQVARRLFESEAQLLHKLGTHDQIPQLLAHFEENKEFYLVQQFIDGHPLSEELTPGKRLSEAYAIALLQNILQPLSFVHQNNVVHRDIKPPNLIRRQSDGKIVLIDFGAVKQIGTQVVNAQGQTKMTVSIGTPGYMPSEQSRGSPRLSSDIYAVGMIGIQALTGLMPDQLQEDVQTAEIIWRHLVPVSLQFAEVLDMMVRYDFRQRYQSATDALAAVQQLSNPHIPPTQYSPPLGYRPTPPPSNSQPPLYSPPPSVPPQYRQEIPQTPGYSPSPQPSNPQPTPPPPLPDTPPKVSMKFTQKDWGLYIQWVLANIFGYFGGAHLLSLISDIAGDPIPGLAFCGLLVGILQWIVLRRQVSVSLWWVLPTTLAAPSTYLFATKFYIYQMLTLGAFYGLIVGIGQWLVLRQLVNKAGWWILANALGAGLSFMISEMVDDSIGRFGIQLFILLGILLGITSGVVLVWLLRDKKSASNS
ncbi:serine/threonine-protein kinase [Fortiea contorta]|uniref:serine/threonine-protein kinase n=1 Tax=Fortiea contorta TaxID=1892405 RepID=UPI0003448DDA|nr:serine/threonine-protein kinase [Fortiea contorta]